MGSLLWEFGDKFTALYYVKFNTANFTYIWGNALNTLARENCVVWIIAKDQSIQIIPALDIKRYQFNKASLEPDC